jgi:hypothetical protein
MRENKYQAGLIKRIEARWPGCFVEKADANLRQGIPDLNVFFDGGFWAKLEVKASESSPHQPNQDYYVAKFNRMSFAAFISPETEEAVLDEIEQALQASWATRLS